MQCQCPNHTLQNFSTIHDVNAVAVIYKYSNYQGDAVFYVTVAQSVIKAVQRYLNRQAFVEHCYTIGKNKLAVVFNTSSYMSTVHGLSVETALLNEVEELIERILYVREA